MRGRPPELWSQCDRLRPAFGGAGGLTALLPPSPTGTLALTGGEDGVRVVTLASPRLFALYRAGYDKGPDDEGGEECRDAVEEQSEAGPVPMLAWLDARDNGLALQFDFAHVEQECFEPVVIPAAMLRREDANARLLTALAAVHAATIRDRPRGAGRRDHR